MQMTVTVGMPGISHSSPTKQHTLAMLRHPQTGPDDMQDMSDEGGHHSLPDTGLNR